MKYSIFTSLILSFVLSALNICIGQTLSGPTSSTVGVIDTYSYTSSSSLPGVCWTVTRGTVQSYYSSGNTYYVTVKWTTTGLGIVTLFRDCLLESLAVQRDSLSNSSKSNSTASISAAALTQTQVAAKNVTVGACSTPSTPIGTFTVSSNACGPKTITFTRTGGIIPIGTEYFWQTISLGTSTSNSGTTYNALSTGTYYLRARVGTCWSTAIEVSVTVDFPGIPPEPSVSANVCGPKVITKPQSSLPTYWQADPNGEDYTSAVATSSTYQVTANGTTIIYLRTRSATGCWSDPRVTSVVVNDLPPPAAANYAFCEQEYMSISTSTAGSNLRWYNASGQILYDGVSYILTDLPVGNYSYFVRSVGTNGCESSQAAIVTVTVNACDEYVNWEEDISYSVSSDGNSKETSSQRYYFDGFGYNIQAQSKSYAFNQIFAAQSINDSYGEPVLNTLEAPINATTFGYRHRFVTNPSGQRYSANDFDRSTTTGEAGEINNPQQVGQSVPGTLGWYYSSANQDANIPQTTFPYSRSWTDASPDPKALVTSRPGNPYRMGSSHENKSNKVTFNKNDLSHYFSLRQYFISADPSASPNLIQVDADGNSTVGFSKNQNITVQLYSSSAGNYVRAISNQNGNTPGIWPIGGNIPVTPGAIYKLRVKGYKTNSRSVNLFARNATTNSNLLWPGVQLPQGVANESWVENSITIPSNCSAINVGVLFNVPALGDDFFINAISVVAVSNDNPAIGYKHTSINGDGKQVVTFEDWEGKVLATAINISTVPGTFTYDVWAYNYYNALGQLVATVDPNGVNTSSSAMPTFVTSNKYDHLGRKIEVSTPDEGTVKYIYSLDGRVRFSQDQGQFNSSPKRFTYNNYDKVGRLIESGEYICRTDAGITPFVFEPSTVLTPASNSVLNIVETLGFAGVTRKGNDAYSSFYKGTSFIDYDYQSEDFQSDSLHPYQDNLLGQISRIKNDVTTTWYSYDEFGQTAWAQQSIADLGKKTIDFVYDFNGNTTLIAYQKGLTDAFYHHFVYNDDQSLIESYTSLDGINKTLHAKYGYYLHGPLKRMELPQAKQGLDYIYTAEGALKSINASDPDEDPGLDGLAGENLDNNRDVFGMTIHYNDNDYNASENLNVNVGTSFPDSYSGNVKAISYHSPVDQNQKHISGFQYNLFNQLVNGQWGSVTKTGSTYNAAFGEAERENIPSYDKNGNIQALIRKDAQALTTANYSYIYEPGTNRLDKINHNGSLLIDYTSDVNGFTTKQQEGNKILSFSYNSFGLVEEVRKEGDTLLLKYSYDGQNNLAVRTVYDKGLAAKSEFFVYDLTGRVLAKYEKDLPSGSLSLDELPIYGIKRLGIYNRSLDRNFYEIKDHLGNVRAVIGAEATQTFRLDFESSDPGEFVNVSRVSFDLMDHTDVAGKKTYSQVLNGGNNSQVGSAKRLVVSPGDIIRASTYAKYKGKKGNSNNLKAFAESLTAAFGLTSSMVGESAKAYNAFQGYGSVIAAGDGAGNDLSPKAFLTILLFDEDHNLVDASWQQVSAEAEQGDGVTKAPHELLEDSLTVTQPGYAYVFVSNENPTQVDVYFDDLSVTQEQFPVVFGADYYPFGLPMREIKDQEYRFGFQGDFSYKNEQTGFNEFKVRMYDPRIGRWLSVDPQNQYTSPYTGMGNAPNMSIDATGGWSTISAGAGLLVGAGVGYLLGGDLKFALIGAGVGGLAGGLSFNQHNTLYDVGVRSQVARLSGMGVTIFGRTLVGVFSKSGALFNSPLYIKPKSLVATHPIPKGAERYYPLRRNYSEGWWGDFRYKIDKILFESSILPTPFAIVTSAEAAGAKAATATTVYISKATNGTVQYVGITNHFAIRAAQHLATKGINIRPLLKGLSRADARCVEQALIEIHGLGKNGGSLLNRINSIAASNPEFAAMLQRGYDLLKSAGYNF